MLRVEYHQTRHVYQTLSLNSWQYYLWPLSNLKPSEYMTCMMGSLIKCFFLVRSIVLSEPYYVYHMHLIIIMKCSSGFSEICTFVLDIEATKKQHILSLLMQKLNIVIAPTVLCSIVFFHITVGFMFIHVVFLFC